MFLHVATNIKDEEMLKSRFEHKSKVYMTEYKNKIYNLSEILCSSTDDKDRLLNELFNNIKNGRKNNELVILYFDNLDDIKKIDTTNVITSNCLILEENILNISRGSCGDYEEKLNILCIDGFNDFIRELNQCAIERDISGMVQDSKLDVIADTFIAFDKVEFNDTVSTSMKINDWNYLALKIDTNMTEYECKKWIFNGMINAVSNIIDEDINYGVNDSFFYNLRDFLCLITF